MTFTLAPWVLEKGKKEDLAKVVLFSFVHKNHRLDEVLNYHWQVIYAPAIPGRRLVDIFKRDWMYIGRKLCNLEIVYL